MNGVFALGRVTQGSTKKVSEGNVSVVAVPGFHTLMFAHPFVKESSKSLRECLVESGR